MLAEQVTASMRCNTVSVRRITMRSTLLDGGLDRARGSGAVTHRRRNRRDGLDRGLVLAYAAGECKGERDLELAAKSLRTNALEPRCRRASKIEGVRCRCQVKAGSRGEGYRERG